MAMITASLPVLPNVWLGTSVDSSDYLGRIDELRKVDAAIRFVSFEPLLGSVARADLTGIQWAIIGGESGPRARPMEEQWVAEIEAARLKARTAFFFKQWAFAKRAPAGIIAGARSKRCRALFDREPRGVGLTTAGHRLREHANAILSALNKTEQDVVSKGNE
jgi:protein gp37